MTTRLDLFLTHLVSHRGDYVLLAARRSFSLFKGDVETPLVEARGDQIINDHVLAILSDVAPPDVYQQIVAGQGGSFFYRSPWGLVQVQCTLEQGNHVAKVVPAEPLSADATSQGATKEPAATSVSKAPDEGAGAGPKSQGQGVMPDEASQGAAPGIRPAAQVRKPVAAARPTAQATQGNTPPTAQPTSQSTASLPTSPLSPRVGVLPVNPGERMNVFIAELLDKNAEALVLETGGPLFLVRYGRPTPLQSARDPVLTNDDIRALLLPIASAHGKERISEGRATSFDYTSPTGDVLVELAPEQERLRARISPLKQAREKGVANTSIPSLICSLQSIPGGRPALERWFDALIEAKGSDLHLTGGLCPVIRVDGEIVPLTQFGVPTVEQLEELVRAVMPPRNLEEFDATGDTDFAYAMPTARLRANVFRDRHGIGAVFRVIPSRVPTAKELNLPPSILELCRFNKGLVLVTGPTGSGKSTTLAAMVDWINENRTGHILTIEDPIEFTHEQKRCLIRQRQVGVHTDSFARALRAALREDPDFVLVGELRDLETVSIALETAETGHLVLATLHTNTAASAVDRIIDQFPADREAQIRLMLADTLRGVVAQTLCRRKEGGRVAALEILRCTTAVSSMIRERKTHQIPTAMQTGHSLGMQTLNDALIGLAQKGVITVDEAYAKAIDRASIKAALVPLGLKEEEAEMAPA